MRTKLVQTNEVRRCALLMPAVAQVASATGKEITLVDIGASSGLNLLLDHYFYKYSNGMTFGNVDSDLEISCEIKDGKLKLVSELRIKNRIGIDLNPIDLNNPDEKLWALSLLWPDQLERIERLKAAIQISKNHPVKLLKGDGTELLPQVASRVAPDEVICVMHSFTLNQFSALAREKFEHALLKVSETHDLWRISLEWLGTDEPELTLDHYASGQLKHTNQLAICHQHGEWMTIGKTKNG